MVYTVCAAYSKSSEAEIYVNVVYKSKVVIHKKLLSNFMHILFSHSHAQTFKYAL